MPSFGALCDCPVKNELSPEGLWRAIYTVPIHFGECLKRAEFAVCYQEQGKWFLVGLCRQHFEALKRLHPEAEGVPLKEVRFDMEKTP